MYRPSTQKGVALITALVFMVTITLLGIISMRSSTLELRLAGNEQARMEAFEIAQSAVDTIVNDAENDDGFLKVNSLGYISCSADAPAPCDDTSLVFDNSVAPFDTANVSWVKVEQLTEFCANCSGKLPRGIGGTSQVVFTSIQYQITGHFDDTVDGNGQAEITQGYLKLIPSGT